MQAQNRYNKQVFQKGWFRGIFLVVVWLLIVSLTRGLAQVRRGYVRIEETRERLEQEQLKNDLLQEKLSLVMTDEYKEKLIREQLNMQKIGEVVAVLPRNDTESTREGELEEEKSNWQKWWHLLE